MASAETLPASQSPAQDPNAPVVVFENVTIGFDRKPVLNNISFQVAPAETRILFGPAGTGKSVLLKLCDGLICPDSGHIYVFGQDITVMSERDLLQFRGRIGMVFQESALFDSLTVRDNVGYRLEEERVPQEEVDRRVLESLQFVELAEHIDKFPSQLSGGQRRRVAIARGIIQNPDLLLYDSPTAGLDPITSTTIVELIIKQRDVRHTTSLLVTHRLQDAFTMATHRYNQVTNEVEKIPDGELDESVKFLVLHEGRIVFDGTTRELVHSSDPFIKDYLS